MASARCLLSFCSLLRSFSMSHCRSSTVVSISDTLVSELVTLSTNSLYCNKGKDVKTAVSAVKQWLHTHRTAFYKLQQQSQGHRTSMDILWCRPCSRVVRSRSRVFSSSRVWFSLIMSDWLSSSHADNKDQ